MLKFHVYRKVNIYALDRVSVVHRITSKDHTSPLFLLRHVCDRTMSWGKLFITSNNVYVNLALSRIERRIFEVRLEHDGMPNRR